ncbi:hypothetical protein WMF31_00625 [Sorangium sp. So ce1036]|uniref:hypothetical protein n=1 Tax=Sorangium sp. So ce1036 TaxID=3133328 RepID=UPI003F044932
MARLSFRETLRRYVPPWLSDRPGRTVGFRFLYAIASVLDAGAEVLVQGLQARFPGLGTPTALPYIGRDRRIVRGPLESDAAYGARLVRWLDYWRAAGNAYVLALALQSFLYPGHPRIRIVTRSGVWYTLEPSGELHWHRAEPSNWDWDSLTHPERAGNWSEFWVIAYPPHYASDGNWGDGTSTWGPGDTFGVQTTTSNIAAIKAIIQQWKGAHTRCAMFILAYDPSSFDPASPPGAPGMPDGRWGHWSKDDGAGGRVKSRREDARYVEV